MKQYPLLAFPLQERLLSRFGFLVCLSCPEGTSPHFTGVRPIFCVRVCLPLSPCSSNALKNQCGPNNTVDNVCGPTTAVGCREYFRLPCFRLSVSLACLNFLTHKPTVHCQRCFITTSLFNGCVVLALRKHATRSSRITRRLILLELTSMHGEDLALQSEGQGMDRTGTAFHALNLIPIITDQDAQQHVLTNTFLVLKKCGLLLQLWAR